jgi:pimeloyl-ACP methyl ester carboxylesterase
MLHLVRHGQPTGRPALLVAHGLFGSGRNLGVVARRLADDREVLVVDMRNHGESFHAPSHTYPEMAADLAEVVEAQGGPVDAMGHSMGGKAAMVLALTRPGLVRRLAVLDIAPVTYGHTQRAQLDAMRRVDLATVASRREAEAQMQAVSPEVAAFLLQGLDLAGRRWRFNLDVLERSMPLIVGFPKVEGRFEGPALFLSGEESSYVLPEHRDEIIRLFPRARFARLKGAGHWLHADRPREVEGAVRAFLDREPPAGGDREEPSGG